MCGSLRQQKRAPPKHASQRSASVGAHRLKRNLAGHTADHNSLPRDPSVSFDRHAAGRYPSSSNTSSSFTSMNHTLIVRQGVCDDAAGAAQHARSRHVQRDSALKPGSTTRKSCGVYRARRLSCTVMWCCAWSWWFFPCRTVCHPHFQGF